MEALVRPTSLCSPPTGDCPLLKTANYSVRQKLQGLPVKHIVDLSTIIAFSWVVTNPIGDSKVG